VAEGRSCTESRLAGILRPWRPPPAAPRAAPVAPVPGECRLGAWSRSPARPPQLRRPRASHPPRGDPARCVPLVHDTVARRPVLVPPVGRHQDPL